MRLLDANLLMYASFDGFLFHKQAKQWLDARLNDDDRLGLPWESLMAFVRLAANPHVIRPCLSVGKAWQQVRYWLSCENVWIPCATARHTEVLNRLLSGYGLTYKHVSDAHLAALAIEHGLILSSADSDFSRFSGLRYENPFTENKR